MSLYVSEAQSILDRFGEKKEKAGLRFSPPDENAELGEYAFPADLFEQIYMGLITGLLTEGVVHLMMLAYGGLRQLFPEGHEHNTEEEQISALIEKLDSSTKLAAEAVKKLQDQGVKADEAQAAVELLIEAVKEEIANKVRKRKSQPGD